MKKSELEKIATMLPVNNTGSDLLVLNRDSFTMEDAAKLQKILIDKGAHILGILMSDGDPRSNVALVPTSNVIKGSSDKIKSEE